MKGKRGLPGNMAFLLRLMWKIAPGRLLAAGLRKLLYYAEWVFYSGIFMQVIVAGYEKGISFSGLLLFVYGAVALSVAVGCYNCWYDAKYQQLSDLDIYEELYGMIFQKAANVGLDCFEDSDFYNEYMLALDDADVKASKIIDDMWSFFFGIIASVVSCALLAQIDPFACVFALGPLVGNFVLGNILHRLIHSCYKESIPLKRFADYVERAVHLPDGAKEIRLTGILKLLLARYEETVEAMNRLLDRYAAKKILADLGYLFLTFTVMFEGVMAYGVWASLVRGTISFAQMSVLSSLMVAVSWILIGCSDSFLSLIRNGMFLDDLRSFLGYTPRLPEDQGGILPECPVEIEFVDVSFSYKGRRVIEHLNLRLEMGKRYALAGYNGAGKSTIIKLLLRFYDPDEGIIRCNGTDIRKYDLKAYRKLFSVALQDGQIFAGTVRENLVLAREDASADEERMEMAVDKSGLRDVLKGLPEGLDTGLTKEFSENGVVLSGGQAQKLSVARAYMTRRPVLVFDEPTSALDPIAEYELFRGMMEMSEGGLLLFISHRLSSVQEVDRIFYIENGRVSESGTHEELMEADEKYALMYKTQARNYRSDAI